MKILFVITGLGIGGAEKILTQLADQMCKKGHTVKIAYLTGEEVVCPQSREIEVIGLKLDSLKNLPTAYLKLKKLIATFQPDIVHSHMFHANIFSRLCRLVIPMNKLICTAHNSNEGGKLRMLGYQFTNSLCDIFTNVSEEATSAFIRKGVAKRGEIITVYNGIDLNKFRNFELDISTYRKKLGLKSSDKVILAVGRLNDQKDYPNLLRALSLLKKERKDFKVIIAGEGVLRSNLEKMINDLNLSSLVTLLGSRQDIPELMKISDLYVLSSKYEGLPTVLIEAMACEKFIVATDCGGSNEILGNTGILIPPNDSIKLAEALNQTMQLDIKQIKLNGYKARARVEELFSLESSVNRWLYLYES